MKNSKCLDVSGLLRLWVRSAAGRARRIRSPRALFLAAAVLVAAAEAGCMATPEDVLAAEAAQAVGPTPPPTTGRGGCDRETASLIQYLKRRYWEVMSRENPLSRQTELCYARHRECAKDQRDECHVNCCDSRFDQCMSDRQFFVDFDGWTACRDSIAINNLYYARCMNQPERVICGDHVVSYGGRAYRCTGHLDASCN